MKISLITVCYDSEKTIEKTIQSVLQQDYKNVEYIIVDGLSNDGTIRVIDKYKNKISKIISEKDDGMYDALNKGIHIATGDLVGILNADDVFADAGILTQIATSFQNDPNLDIVIGDIKFLDTEGKSVRYYSSAKWHPDRFVWGFMPAHPSFYCKKKYFNEIGNYRLDFDIAADYELLIRFLKINNLKFKYLPLLMVLMKTGGKSTQGLASTFKINKEIWKACQINGLYTNYIMLYLKYFSKIFEMGKRKNQVLNER